MKLSLAKKVMLVVVVYGIIVGWFLYTINKDDALYMTEAEETEFKCLVEHHKLCNGAEIYNFPDNPYFKWAGKKIYMREEGVCGG